MKTFSTTLILLLSTYAADARVLRGNRKLHSRPGFHSRPGLKASNQGWYKHRKGHNNRGFVPHMNNDHHESYHDIRKQVSKAITSELLDASWAPHDSPNSYLVNTALDFCATVQGKLGGLNTQDLTFSQFSDGNNFTFNNMPEFSVENGTITYVYKDTTSGVVQTKKESGLQLSDVLLGATVDLGTPEVPDILITGRGLGYDGLLDGRDASSANVPLILERVGSTYAGYYNISQGADNLWTGTFDAGTDLDQCGQDNCNSGSFVNTVAKLIRAKGLHVRHDDICESYAGEAPLKGNADEATVFTGVHTCNLRPTTPRKTYKCEDHPTKLHASARLLDFHEILQVCHDYEANNPGKCSEAVSEVPGFTNTGFCQVSGDGRECIVDHNYMTAANLRNCDEIVIDTNGDESEQNLQASLMIAGSEKKINVFQRATRYARPTTASDVLVHTLGSTIPRLADADNYATVGSIDGCKSQRGLVLANYGAQLESKFRDAEFTVEEKRFIKEIKAVDALVERIGENMELDFIRLPLIPMITSPGMLISTGPNGDAYGMTPQKPFADGKGTEYRGNNDGEYFCGVSHSMFGVLEGRDSSARTIDEVISKRKTCVCRGHDSNQVTQGPANMVNYAFGYDELYLQRNNSISDCSSLKAYYVTDHGATKNEIGQDLWSVQQYCENFDTLADAEDWSIRVGRLIPSINNIPSSGNGWTEADISNVTLHISDSLNFEWSMNRCGRIVNAAGPENSLPADETIKMSTSGGNDIPYTDATISDGGLQGKEDIAEILYQLEAESIGDIDRAYSLRSKRTELGAGLADAKAADEITLSDMICAPGLTDDATIFSFRQLRWKDGDYDDSKRRDEFEASDPFTTWKTSEGTTYWSNNDATNGTVAALDNYCIPDWQVVLGVVSVETDDFSDRGGNSGGKEEDVKVYKIDPLGVDARDILEIGYNVHIAQKAQKRSAAAQETIRAEILRQLTEVDGGKDGKGFDGKFKNVDMIGFDVFEHYARVAAATTDANAFNINSATTTSHWNTRAQFLQYFGVDHHSPEIPE